MVRMPIINPWSRSLIPKLIGKWGVDTLVRPGRPKRASVQMDANLEGLLRVPCRSPPVVSRKRRFRPASRTAIICCASR
jgi:hypothetical protein